MRKFYSMFRVFMRIILGQALAIKVKGRESRAAGILLWGVVAVSVAPIAFVIFYMVNELFMLFAYIGHLDFGVGLALNVGAVIIFMLSLLAAPAIFYFSKDVEYLLPMPVKPAQIIGAKFAVALVFEYLIAVVLVGVMFFALLGHVGVGWLTFNMLLTALTLPILPLVYSTVVIMLLMRFVRFIRNPDRYNWIIGLLGLGFMVVFMVQSQEMFTLDEDALMAMLTGEPVAMTAIRWLFPTNMLAAYGVQSAHAIYTGQVGLGPGEVILPQLLNVAVAALGLVVFFFLASLLYFKGVLGLSESGGGGKKMTRDEVLASASGQGVFRAYIMKELRLLFRSPTAFMNCVLMVLLMPIILLIAIMPFFSGGDEGIMEFIRGIDFSDPRTAAISLVGMTILSLMMSGSATITACAISREGRNFFVMKFLPVPYRTQLNAKAFSGLAVIFVGKIVVFIPLWVLFNPPVLLGLACILVAVPVAVFLNYLGLFFDILKPKLEWDNEAEAVKQNMNILLMMFGAWGVAIGVGALGWFVLTTPVLAFAVLFFGGLVLMLLALWLALVKGAVLLKNLH